MAFTRLGRPMLCEAAIDHKVSPCLTVYAVAGGSGSAVAAGPLWPVDAASPRGTRMVLPARSARGLARLLCAASSPGLVLKIAARPIRVSPPLTWYSVQPLGAVVLVRTVAVVAGRLGRETISAGRAGAVNKTMGEILRTCGLVRM